MYNKIKINSWLSLNFFSILHKNVRICLTNISYSFVRHIKLIIIISDFCYINVWIIDAAKQGHRYLKNLDDGKKNKI